METTEKLEEQDAAGSALKLLLGQEWFTVCPPWGNGTAIRAGSPDCGGELVADMESLLDECDGGWKGEEAASLAEHIVQAHNACRGNKAKAYIVIDEDGAPIHCAGWERACHEHINEALDMGLEEAKGWKVRAATYTP